MKQWSSIEELAENLGISERTAFRWLRSGKIKRKRSGYGQRIFVVAQETDTDSDVSATDSDTDVSVNVSDTTDNDTDMSVNVSNKIGGRRREEKSLVDSLEDELKASRVEFEIEKLQDAKEKWMERKNREKKEEEQSEQALKFQELALRQRQHEDEKRQREVRARIQQVKNAVCDDLERKAIPAPILAMLYQEIEKLLGRMDVLSIPLDELLIYSHGIKEKLYKQFANEILQHVQRQAVETINEYLNEYLKKTCSISLQEVMRLADEIASKGVNDPHVRAKLREISTTFRKV